MKSATSGVIEPNCTRFCIVSGSRENFLMVMTGPTSEIGGMNAVPPQPSSRRGAPHRGAPPPRPPQVSLRRQLGDDPARDAGLQGHKVRTVEPVLARALALALILAAGVGARAGGPLRLGLDAHAVEPLEDRCRHRQYPLSDSCTKG